jgi:flagellar biogenesis protein FliO
MYRLLLWSMLFWSLSHCALAVEDGLNAPHRLQPDQMHGRPIGQTGYGDSPAWAETPKAFQPQSTERNPLRATYTGPTGDASVASHQSSAPADNTNVSPASSPPFQALNRLPAATQPPRGPSPVASTPLPISRNSTSQPAADNDKSPITPEGDKATSTNIDSLITVAGSLGIVLGLFLVTMWCLRRGMPKSARSLPPEVVEVLGRAPLAGKHQMHLIRFGNKLVLAAVSPAGVDTISEITDPMEANRLAGYFEQTRPTSATASFRGILDRLDDSGAHEIHEKPRRPNRGLASLLGLKGSDAEDEYV